jgi:hypothetical protein
MQANDKEPQGLHKLVFLEKQSDIIHEVMGVSDSVFEKTRDDMVKFFVFDSLHDSFTTALKNFIESPYFGRSGFALETENDYMALGYMFAQVVQKVRKEQKKEVFKEMGTMIREVTKSEKKKDDDE